MATLDGIGRAATGQHPALKWAYLLVAAALMIEMIVLIIGIVLGVLTDDYYSNSKALRDAGGAGLLSDLGDIQSTGVWLGPLQFFGLSMFFAGITAVLAIIIKTLQLRGQALELALPQILGKRGNATAEES
ncbi:MAG: hypothetical protein O3C10_11930 [Chloroflexi bacterium]|nr:hypothetical protein [Chloroflexota bacterium]